jgi:SpoVK/Ycf46/Vps4 family AAA+-type ATPase
MAVELSGPLARLDARIAIEIARLRARYDLSVDEFRGLYVSDAQVDRLVADARPELDAADVVTGGPLEPLTAGARDDARWRHVAAAFGLSPLEEDLVLLAAAPELDLRYETLYAYLNDDVARRWPTVDLACRLLRGVGGADEIVGALVPGGTLRSWGVVRAIDPPAGRPTLRNAGYALHPCVVAWLHGHSPGLAIDGAAVTWTPSIGLRPPDAVAVARAAPVLRLAEARRARGGAVPIVALVGRPGCGRTRTAMALASAGQWPLARVNLRACTGVEEQSTSRAGQRVSDELESLAVALALEEAIVLVDGAELLVDEARGADAAWCLLRAVAACPTSALVLVRGGEDEGWRALATVRRVVEVRCDDATFDERVAAWRDAARDEAVALSEAQARRFAGRAALTAGQVRAAVATARDLAAMSGEVVEPADVDVERVAAAARLASDQALGRVATKVRPRHSWGDLVLPTPTLHRLRELAAAVQQRHVVFDEWGFGERLASGVGIRALFAGASGTGKTMAAGVVAREAGLELYRVDLAGLVSKYIGETEKNLDRLFRAASATNAIVFLDEAEAIMGKRSEVKDAHDRYANIEVAYLLQKLEEHDGIVILATNLKRNIDDAFARRMQYVIDFPRPEAAERERIWRSMFPARAPLASDVDFTYLARQFDLAGGDIRNVALDAAFFAAQDGGVIDMRVVVGALARQLAKQGKTPTGREFGQYQRLLMAGERRDAL